MGPLHWLGIWPVNPKVPPIFISLVLRLQVQATIFGFFFKCLFWGLNSVTPIIKTHGYSFSLCIWINMCRDIHVEVRTCESILFVLCGSQIKCRLDVKCPYPQKHPAGPTYFFFLVNLFFKTFIIHVYTLLTVCTRSEGNLGAISSFFLLHGPRD